MSVVGMYGPTPQLFGSAGGPSRTEPSTAAQAETRRAATPKDESARVAATGGGAPAERTKAPEAKRAVPPTARIRDTNAASGPRPGADGDDSVAIAREAPDDQARIDAESEAREHYMRRDAEAARDRLISQEIMSRIPVPVAALPRLTADAMRMTDGRALMQDRSG